jgi:hypothetical protein
MIFHKTRVRKINKFLFKLKLDSIKFLLVTFSIILPLVFIIYVIVSEFEVFFPLQK